MNMNGFYLKDEKKEWKETVKDIWDNKELQKYKGKGYKLMELVTHPCEHYRELNTWIMKAALRN